MRPAELGIAMAWAFGAAVFGSAQITGDGSWSRGMAMPTERGEVGAAVLDGKVYVEGAYSGESVANEPYDPATDSSQKLELIPQPRNHVSATAIVGALYWIGAFDPNILTQPVAYPF